MQFAAAAQQLEISWWVGVWSACPVWNCVLPPGQGLSGQVKLRILRLDHNHLRGLTAAELASCAQLQVVDLSHNLLEGVSGLGRLTELRELRLAHNLLPALPDLRHLNKVCWEWRGRR